MSLSDEPKIKINELLLQSLFVLKLSFSLGLLFIFVCLSNSLTTL